MRTLVLRGLIAAIVIAFTLGFGAAAKAQLRVAAKGEWDAGTTYIKDDIVTARGSSWISLRNNNLNKVPGQTQPSSAAYWELFARGFNPVGAWSNATKYQPDDLVTNSGQTYRAKLTNTNRPTTNATFWELLASKGAAGATGATGPAGPNTGIGNGSTSAPSISFSGDSDTGIFHPAAGKIALVEDAALFLHNLGTNNSALGVGALQSNTGSDNSAFGKAAAISNTTGSQNTAVGNQALAQNTTGSSNTAVGATALNFSTGDANTAVGASSLVFNTSGAQNTAVGTAALFNNTTASNNTAVGASALSSNSTGQNNVVVGSQALTANTSGNDNVAIGQNALAASSNVSGNIAIGSSALASFGSLQIGGVGGNIAIGNSALTNVTTARDNIAIGYTTLTSNVTGGNNTAVGSGAVAQLTSGGSNTALGFSTLGTVTTGSNNIALGWGSGTNAGNISDSIFVGNFGDSGDTATIKIGIEATQTRTFIAGINGITTGQNDAVPVLVDSNGQLGVTSSSRRYKYDIASMADVSAMLSKLRPVTFRYKQAQNGGAHPLQYGLIAEEVADVFPDLAVFKDGQPETVKYQLLPSFLLAGWQAQQQTIAAQAEKIETLAEARRQQNQVNADLEARLRRLETFLPQSKAAAN
jgi:trimeric autotransporter adhesin